MDKAGYSWQGVLDVYICSSLEQDITLVARRAITFPPVVATAPGNIQWTPQVIAPNPGNTGKSYQDVVVRECQVGLNPVVYARRASDARRDLAATHTLAILARVSRESGPQPEPSLDPSTVGPRRTRRAPTIQEVSNLATN